MGEFMRFARYVFFGATVWLIPGMIFSFITISPGASESIRLYLIRVLQRLLLSIVKTDGYAIMENVGFLG